METAELDRFQASLYSLREDLRKQLADLGANPDEDSLEGLEFDFGFADSAQSTAERGKVLALIDRLRTQLRDVERALKKIDQGTYGQCDNCGKEIPRERLEALPYTTLCVDCKQKSA
jgi:RNA polymerase-binding protein DksA